MSSEWHIPVISIAVGGPLKVHGQPGVCCLRSAKAVWETLSWRAGWREKQKLL